MSFLKQPTSQKKISAVVLMKSITSVFVFILAASFSLGTQLPENGSPPADTKIPQAASGNPGMFCNNYASMQQFLNRFRMLDTRRDSELFIAP